jgi:Na+/H+ antiporter NhaD/arsenite permease-like protein
MSDENQPPPATMPRFLHYATPWIIYAALAVFLYSFFYITLPDRIPSSDRSTRARYLISVQDYIVQHELHAQYIAVCAFVLVGFVFYTFRGQLRALYGFVELTASVVLVIGSITDFSHLFITETSLIEPPNLQPDILQLLAGIYVMVRGLDNIENGLPSGFVKTSWRRILLGKD